MISPQVSRTPPEQTLPGLALIQTSAPGRLCLFGEHQDYLRLPVIAMAIDLRITLNGRRRSDSRMFLQMPDLDQEFDFDPNEDFAYRHLRDYLPAAANCLRRLGLRWPCGYDIEVTSTIPINGGASSSSALQVAWIAFLLAAAGDPRVNDSAFVAHQAYMSEVREFHSPGGMMDHYSSAIGGVIWLDCLDPISWQRLPDRIGPFLLIDSGTPKNTNGVLGRVRQEIESGLEQLGIQKNALPNPLETLRLDQLPDFLAPEIRASLGGTLLNRDITRRAHTLLSKTDRRMEQIGALLSEHQAQLCEALRISTPQIDEILRIARAAGGLGGKINGSGGGGTCFVLCGDQTQAIAQALDAAGYHAWQVECGPGLQVNCEPES